MGSKNYNSNTEDYKKYSKNKWKTLQRYTKAGDLQAMSLVSKYFEMI